MTNLILVFVGGVSEMFASLANREPNADGVAGDSAATPGRCDFDGDLRS